MPQNDDIKRILGTSAVHKSDKPDMELSRALEREFSLIDTPAPVTPAAVRAAEAVWAEVISADAFEIPDSREEQIGKLALIIDVAYAEQTEVAREKSDGKT
jgi:hypothetical protein